MSNSRIPVLADFGAALVLQEPSVISISTGFHCNVRYAAIELLDLKSGVRTPTEKSDIWGLGMVIYVRRIYPYIVFALIFATGTVGVEPSVLRYE